MPCDVAHMQNGCGSGEMPPYMHWYIGASLVADSSSGSGMEGEGGAIQVMYPHPHPQFFKVGFTSLDKMKLKSFLCPRPASSTPPYPLQVHGGPPVVPNSYPTALYKEPPLNSCHFFSSTSILMWAGRAR